RNSYQRLNQSHSSAPCSAKPRSKEGTNQRDKCSYESAPAVMFISSKTPILLQTTPAIVKKTGSSGRKIRIILDSGSQRSYITNPLKKELTLQVDHQEAMLIKTFSSKEENIKLLGWKDMQMPACSVPLICEPFTGQTVDLAKKTDDCLKTSGPAEADILTGSDHYWQLVTGEERKGDSCPMAVNTGLGWVLSGPIVG
ncbi:hypothetical protein P5673_006699, partial [Acropora cervicornis]